MIGHIRRISLKCLAYPGLSVCIDGQMIRCTGRTGETHRIKGKPTGEGYKFFVLADSRIGCVIHFILDGRLASKRSENEFSKADSNYGKIVHMLQLMYEVGLK